MREAVETCPQQALRVVQRVDVGRDAKLVLMRFVDDRAVELGRQLLVLPVAIVDPDLHHVDFLRSELLYSLPRLCLGRHPVRRFGSARLRSCYAAAHCSQAGCARNRILPQLKCDVVVVLPHADDGGDAEVGLALQQIHERLPLGGHVRMGIDDCRHHRLAGQVHA